MLEVDSRDSNRINLFDGFTLDLARGCVTRSGEPVHLRPQTYEVLKYLVENRNHLISKDKLIEEVWQGRAVTDGSLGKCIEELRDALGNEARHFIRNVRGRGYIFDTGVEERAEHRAPPAQSEQIEVVRVLVHEEETDEQSPAATVSRAGARPATVALVIAAVFVAVAATTFATYWIITHRQSGNSALTGVPFGEMKIARLTTSGKITHAALSADGKYVAHVTKDADGDSLWVRNVGAPTSVRIAGPAATEYVSVTFAPDGESIYYLTLDRDKGHTTLCRVPVLGGPSTIAVDDAGPVGFSPDRTRIAFIRMYGEESRLLIANPDGANERVLAVRRQPEYFREDWNAPAWSTDGTRIACQVRLKDERGQFETIIGVSVADGSQVPLTSGRWSYAGQPVWLADGSGLMVTASERAGAPEQIWHIELKSGEAIRVTHDLNDYSELSLTADSNRLAAVQANTVSSIWMAPEGDAGRAKEIASDIGWNEEVAWTPDGRIVYRSNAGDNAEIWVMNADGSDPRQLTTNARASRGLSISPDGRYIFFASDRTGHSNIWRADSDGGNLKQMTFGDGEFYPACTPDGRSVVYHRDEIESRLWKVPANGGEPVQLTKTRARRPAVSPDGQMIAYHYLDPDVEKSQWRIGVVSSGGGPPLKWFDFPPTLAWRFVRWAPDGRAIAYVNSPGGLSDIWLQSLDGGPPKQMTNFKSEQILAFDWSRDGRSLAVIRGVQTRDVVLIDQLKRTKRP